MIAENAPLSVEGSKFMAQQWRQLMIDESYRTGEWVSRAVLNSEDAKEGPRAFSEKREPRCRAVRERLREFVRFGRNQMNHTISEGSTP